MSKAAAKANAARSFAADIVDDPKYREMLKVRAIAGDLAPGVESTLLAYRFGKPTEHVIIDHGQDLSDMTTPELRSLLSHLLTQLDDSGEEESTALPPKKATTH